MTALLRNTTDAPLTATVRLEAEGLTTATSAPRTLEVPAMGEARVQWTLEAQEAAPREFRITAHAGNHADALVRPLPVQKAGFVESDHSSGRSAEREVVRVRFDERGPTAQSPSLSLSVAPGIAPVLMAALPDLITFPYNCREQALSRIFPATLLAQALEDAGHAFDGQLDEAANTIARRLGIALPAEGGFAALSSAILAQLIHASDDTGWSWFPGGSPDPFISSYLYWGLTVLEAEDLSEEASYRLDEAGDYLLDQIGRLRRPDDRAWTLFALAQRPPSKEEELLPFLHALEAEADQLSPAGLALLSLSAHHLDEEDRAKRLLARLADRARSAGDVTDPNRPHLTYWGDASRRHFRWMERAEPATALALLALNTIEPDHRLVDSAEHWLLTRRRSVSWANTLDTAIALVALAQRIDGPLSAGTRHAVVRVNGREALRIDFDSAAWHRPASKLTIPKEFLPPHGGAIDLEIEADGPAKLHWQASLEWWETASPVDATGHIIALERNLVALESDPTLFAGPVIRRVPLAQSAVLTPETRQVEAVLTLSTPVDLEYLKVEVPKPAGLEHTAQTSGWGAVLVELTRSGETDGRRLFGYAEWRDDRAVFFFDRLPEGSWELRYRLRAEAPGEYASRPARIEAMYAPGVSARSADGRLRVEPPHK